MTIGRRPFPCKSFPLAQPMLLQVVNVVALRVDKSGTQSAENLPCSTFTLYSLSSLACFDIPLHLVVAFGCVRFIAMAVSTL